MLQHSIKKLALETVIFRREEVTVTIHNMESNGLGGGISAAQRRKLCPSAFTTDSSRPTSGSTVYAASDRSNSFTSDTTNLFEPLPSSTTVANTDSVGFGCCFGNNCYVCKIPHSVGSRHNVMRQITHVSLGGYSGEQFMDIAGLCSASLHSNDIRVKEFSIYQGCPDPYSRIPAHADVPVVPRAATEDPRHDTIWPIEGYQTWSWSDTWKGPFNCTKEQTESPRTWRSPLTGDLGLNQTDMNPVCRREKKKRVPYTKLQLKELEREYSVSKFITKDKRRRIASSTNLTERQVTIWFQNRRVKEKKNVCKPKDCT